MTNTNADCAFWIGRTHRICQDYALAANDREEALVVLADGCSSSPDTDIGARLLARCAARLLAGVMPGDGAAWDDWHAEAVLEAATCARHLGLPATCLDATLLTIRATGGTFAASCCGDGVVALGRRDGRVEVSATRFAANCPWYASYLLDEERRRRWEEFPDNARTVERWTLGGGTPETDSSPTQQPVELFTGSVADYRFVAVLSDGVQSFARAEQTDTSRLTRPVRMADVLAGLLAFKGGNGEFVRRRAQAFGRECQARGWHHADDISLGVVWLGD